MPNKIAELKIEEVSLVDVGANQHAHIQLWKRADTQTTGAGAQVQELKKEPPVAEAEKKVEEPVDTLTTDLDSMQKRNAALEAELAKVRTELGSELEAREKELAASKAETVKIQKQRRRERFIKRAEELDHLPGAKADDFAEILDTINEKISEKLFTKFNNLLTAWNTVMEKNDLLFREIGAEGGNMGMLSGTQAQVDVLAQEKMAADPKLSKAQAIDRVLKEKPELYHKYLREQGGQ